MGKLVKKAEVIEVHFDPLELIEQVLHRKRASTGEPLPDIPVMSIVKHVAMWKLGEKGLYKGQACKSVEFKNGQFVITFEPEELG